MKIESQTLSFLLFSIRYHEQVKNEKPFKSQLYEKKLKIIVKFYDFHLFAMAMQCTRKK